MSQFFISYNHEFSTYAKKVAEELEKHGFNVWFDERIESGDRWFKVISRAIHDSDAVLVIMTPEAEESKWVEREILLAQKHEKPIYPLLREGKEFDLLIDLQYVDVRDGSLPPLSFYEKLHELSDPNTLFVPKRRQQVRFLPRIGRWHLLTLVIIVVAVIIIYFPRQSPKASQESEPAQVSRFLKYEFPIGFWAVGNHEYTISVDCVNDLYDFSSSNRFNVSAEADLINGDIELRANGLFNNGTLLDNSQINPQQATVAAVTITVTDDVNNDDQAVTALMGELAECRSLLRWDDDEEAELLSSLPTISFTD